MGQWVRKARKNVDRQKTISRQRGSELQRRPGGRDTREEAWILRRQTCRGIKRADHWSIYCWRLLHDPPEALKPLQGSPNQPLGPKPPTVSTPLPGCQPGTPPILEDFPIQTLWLPEFQTESSTSLDAFLAAHTYHPLPPLLSTTVHGHPALFRNSGLVSSVKETPLEHSFSAIKLLFLLPKKEHRGSESRIF